MNGIVGNKIAASIAAAGFGLGLVGISATTTLAGQSIAPPAKPRLVAKSDGVEPQSSYDRATAAKLLRPTTTGSIEQTGAIYAPPVQAHTGLTGALSQGYAENPSLEAARAGTIEADEGVAIAIAALRPTITATASTGYIEERRFKPSFEDRRHPQSAGINASLLLFDGFSSLNNVRAAEARAVSSQHALTDSEQRLLAEIAAAYANVWRDRSIVTLEKQNVGFLKEQYRSAKRRRQLGDLSRTDVAQAEARLHEARANLSAAQADLVASNATYTELVGSAPSKVASPRVPKSLFPATLDEALSEASKFNPMMKKAAADEQAADLDVDASIGAFFPKITVDAGYDTNSRTASSYKTSDEFSAYLRVNFPFYDGGAKEARHRQAKAAAIKSSYQKAAAKRGVWSSVQTLWHRRKAAKARIYATSRQLTAANLAVKGLKVEARVGQRSIIDILDGQRDRVAAKISVAKARAEYVTTSYQLLAAMGKCTPHHLGLPVEEHDSTARLASIKSSWLGLFIR